MQPLAIEVHCFEHLSLPRDGHALPRHSPLGLYDPTNGSTEGMIVFSKRQLGAAKNFGREE
jgi:hypothetical protein